MLDKDLHRTYLVNLLKDIYSNKSIAPILGFKGGTAAYFFHGLNRFSVDLDFDLLKPEFDKEVFEKILNIAQKHGAIKESRSGHKSILVSISYKTELQNLKIEISKRNFGSKYERKNYMGLSLQTMVKEDIFANKLVALTDRARSTNRDLYDIYFFLENNWDINEEIVKERTSLKLKDYLKKCLKHVEKINRTHILAGIGDLISIEKKAWVKNKLLDELVFKINQRILNIDKA